MSYLVLLRHGQSVWNKRLRFTGWSQAPLSARGRAEAAAAGQLLRRSGLTFDVCFTSWLERAAETAAIALRAMQLELDLKTSWRLNERHYGKLQGHGIGSALLRYGLPTLLATKYGFAAVPPAMAASDPRFSGNDPLYRGVPQALLPRAESMAQALNRLMPYWRAEIEPLIRQKKRVLIVSHSNLLRALIKYLEDLPVSSVAKCRLPTAQPLIYELDEHTKPVNRYFASAHAVKW